MVKDKQIRHYAKSLLNLSLEGDEVSSERVDAVLKYLDANPPRRHRAILREYLRLVQKQIAHGQARVEYAGNMPADLVNAIEASLSAHYGRPITAVTAEKQELIAGWRIRVGSDVYDSSIQNRLNQMAKATAR